VRPVYPASCEPYFNCLKLLHLHFQLGEFFLQPHGLSFTGRGLLPTRNIKCRQITVDARFDFLHTLLQICAGEITVAVVHGLEFTAINGDQVFTEQSQLLTQDHELATDAPDSLDVVFSEAGDDLKNRRQNDT
jgi:hypothetical protein